MFKSNVLQNVDNETYMQPQNPTPPQKKIFFLKMKRIQYVLVVLVAIWDFYNSYFIFILPGTLITVYLYINHDVDIDAQSSMYYRA